METQKWLTDSLDEFGTDCSEKVRRAPIQSILIAGGIGYLLRFIPIFSLTAILIRLVVASIRPALLIFGIAQVAKCLKANCCCGNGKAPAESELEFPRPLDS